MQRCGFLEERWEKPRLGKNQNQKIVKKMFTHNKHGLFVSDKGNLHTQGKLWEGAYQITSPQKENWRRKLAREDQKRRSRQFKIMALSNMCFRHHCRHTNTYYNIFTSINLSGGLYTRHVDAASIMLYKPIITGWWWLPLLARAFGWYSI